MNWRVLAALAVLGVAAGCGARTAPVPPSTARPAPSATGPVTSIRVGPGPGGSGEVRVVALEAYVEGVVAAEQAVGALPAAVAVEVLQVQAIISRTFALAHVGRHGREGFDLCTETHCQLYRPLGDTPHRALVAEAVRTTAAQVLTYNGQPIDALFHSNCGGHTSAADAVWGGPPQPYFASVADEFCLRDPGAAWTLTVDREELRRIVNRERLTTVGDRFDAITVLSRDAGGRAVLLALEGQRSPVVRGEEFRRVVAGALGARSLRSLQFSVERTATGAFRFSGRGFGHGAGLCQAGALSRIRAGASPQEVLAYYYPGAQPSATSAITRRPTSEDGPVASIMPDIIVQQAR